MMTTGAQSRSLVRALEKRLKIQKKLRLFVQGRRSALARSLSGDVFMFPGEANLPDSVDACRTSRLGPGERRAALHEVGDTHRYDVRNGKDGKLYQLKRK